MKRGLLLAVYLASLSSVSHSTPQFFQEAYLKASDTDGGDFFGYSVDVSGDTAVVGAPNADAAYVFVRSGGEWSFQARITGLNTEDGDGFGVSVSISGDTIVVGARYEDSSAIGVDGNGADNTSSHSGAAYVFVRDGTTWPQQAYLKASNNSTGGFPLEFGSSVAISVDTVVVGAPHEDSASTGVNGDQGNTSAAEAGAAYVFVRDGLTWSQQAYLKASNTGSWDQFGDSITIDGDTIAVGAIWEGSAATGINGNQADNSASNSGAVYVFTRAGVIWTQQAYLKASNTGTGDYFGTSVDIDGNTLVTGALYERSNASGVNGDQNNDDLGGSGAAYVYSREDGVWSQQAYLKASNPGSDDRFGISATVSGDLVLVGAYQEGSRATGINGDQDDNFGASAGAVYAFRREGENWGQEAYIKASDNSSVAIGKEFGYSVAIDGNVVIVGAIREQSSATGVNGDQTDNSLVSAGAAYAFGFGEGSIPETPPSLTLAPRPKPFPSTFVGRRSRPQIVTLHNEGGSTASGIRSLTTGRSRREFKVTQPARKSLSAGALTSFRVTFRPRTSGKRRAALEVISSAPQLTIGLSGKGRSKR